jgi:hypothetical protein
VYPTTVSAALAASGELASSAPVIPAVASIASDMRRLLVLLDILVPFDTSQWNVRTHVVLRCYLKAVSRESDYTKKQDRY